MALRVALILGAGPNVGINVAKAFAAQGYKEAIASRSRKDNEDTRQFFPVQGDFGDPTSIEDIFATMTRELGHPSVVVYNGTFLFDCSNLTHATTLKQQISAFQRDNNINIVSTYTATQFAIRSFSVLPPESSKTFIYTGNKQHLMVIPPLLSQGVGFTSRTSANLTEARYMAPNKQDNQHTFNSAISGSAHGSFYTELAAQQSQGPWNATFVKNQGYVAFSENVMSATSVDRSQVCQTSS
ncbi:hypothetical protein MKX07_003086 [Trichoderma sp. CBMAI-0711]|nr:hypothetical protein MKX07_003086 [Trichoderma sp. CBMAI-0711]